MVIEVKTHPLYLTTLLQNLVRFNLPISEKNEFTSVQLFQQFCNMYPLAYFAIYTLVSYCIFDSLKTQHEQPRKKGVSAYGNVKRVETRSRQFVDFLPFPYGAFHFLYPFHTDVSNELM